MGIEESSFQAWKQVETMRDTCVWLDSEFSESLFKNVSRGPSLRADLVVPAWSARVSAFPLFTTLFVVEKTHDTDN